MITTGETDFMVGWLAIAKWFTDWDNWIRSLPDLSRSEKQRMFITHQLHGDLQRTCHSMHDIFHCYVVGNVHRTVVGFRKDFHKTQ